MLEVRYGNETARSGMTPDDIHHIRAAIRKHLLEKAQEQGARNGSTLKNTIQDYAYHAGITQGLKNAADLIDELFKQGNQKS